jgi:hypothetical protein
MCPSLLKMAYLWGQVIMTSQINLEPLMACVPTIVELSETDWLAAVAFASMRRALNDGDRGPQRDMGRDINQRGDETGLIGEIVGLRVAEDAYSEPTYKVRHNLLAWRRPLDAPDITVEETSSQSRLQIEVKTLGLQRDRKKFLMNLRGHDRSKRKGVTHYLFAIVVSGGRHALVSELVSVATVDETFTIQDEKFGRGQNRSIGVDLDPFLDSLFGEKPENLVPTWNQLDEYRRKISLLNALRGDEPVAPNRLELAARYGAVDLVVRLRGRSDTQEMHYTQALNYVIRALRCAHKHAEITANPDGPLPLANASHELEALEAARQCKWPTHEPRALRSLLHELTTDMRLDDNPIRQSAFNTLRGDAFFGDQSPWLVP